MGDIRADPSAIHEHAAAIVRAGQEFSANFSGAHGSLTTGAAGAGHAGAAAALASFTAAAHRAHAAVGQRMVDLGNAAHNAADGYQSTDGRSAVSIEGQAK